MSTTEPVTDDRTDEKPPASQPKRSRGNRLTLVALPLLFIILPWVLGVAAPAQAVAGVLVITPLALAALAIFDARTFRPNLTFALIMTLSMWVATRLFYPEGAGWYIWGFLLLYALITSPWRKKFIDEWGSKTDEAEEGSQEAK